MSITNDTNDTKNMNAWYNLKMKNTHVKMVVLLKLQNSACNFTKSSTPPWVFFTFFKL